jgi:hypothetical protein
VEDQGSGAATAVAVAVSDQGKCTKLFAQIAARNAKFLSSQQKANQYTAETVIRSIRNSNYVFKNG